MRFPIPLIVILALFAVLCGLFNQKTPYRQQGLLVFQTKIDPATGQRVPNVIPDVGAPDERQHANYILHLKEGKGFPVLVPGSPDLGETYQSHQPPLYYILAAGWSSLTGADPNDADAGFRLRLLNTLMGLGTLIGIYYGALWGLGREDVALASAAFGLLPMNIALNSAITNDSLLFCLCTWSLALTLKCLQQGWHIKKAALIGVLIGLGILTKTTALVMFPVVMAALILSHKRHQAPAKPNVAVWAFCLALPLIIALPWLIRNTNLYGDPFGMSAFNAAFTGSPSAEVFVTALGAGGYWSNMVGWWTSRSFIGVFGYMDIFLFEQMGNEKSGLIYIAILFLLGATALFGQVGFPKFKAEAEDQSLPQPGVFQIVTTVMILFTLVLFVQFNLKYFQGQARYLFPAIAAFAYFFGMGAVRLFGNYGKNAWIGVGILMLLLDFASYSAITNGFAMRLL